MRNTLTLQKLFQFLQDFSFEMEENAQTFQMKNWLFIFLEFSRVRVVSAGTEKL